MGSTRLVTGMPLSVTGFPLELLVLAPVVVALLALVRPTLLAHTAPRLVLGSVLPVLVLAAIAVRPAGAALYRPLATLLRVGSFDLGYALVLDDTSAVVILGLGLVATLLSVSPSPSMARLHAIAAGATLTVLADSLPLALVGWLAVVASAAPVVSTVRFAWARLGEVALLVAMSLVFWSLGGTWDDRGYAPDHRPRFAPSNAGDDPATAHRGEGLLRDARLAQLDPDAVPTGTPDINRPLEVPRRRAPARPDVPRELPTATTGHGFLTMTTHPGALVYLGVATVDELQANRGRPRCELSDGIRTNCIAVAPFTRVPVRAGVHRVAIVPGAAAIVGGEGVEAAGFTLHVDVDEEVHLEAIGPTLRFREIEREIQRVKRMAETLPSRTIFGVSALWLAALLAALGLGAMSGLFPIFWLADAASSRDDARGGVMSAIVAPLVAAYLAARLQVTLAPAMVPLAIVATGSSILAGAIASRQLDFRRAFGFIAAALAGLGLAGVASSWAVIVGAVVSASCLAAFWVALENARGANPPSLDGVGGLKAAMPRSARASLVAAAGLVAIPPLGGFFPREGAAAAANAVGGMLLWVAFVAAAAASAFAVARLHFVVFEGSRQGANAKSAGAKEAWAPAMVALVAAALAVLVAALMTFSDRPLGGAGAPFVATTLGGELGADGGGRALLAALLTAAIVVAVLAARRQYAVERPKQWARSEARGRVASWLAAEAGMSWFFGRLEHGARATLGGLRRVEELVTRPFAKAGGWLGSFGGNLGASKAGRAALCAGAVLLAVLAVGFIAR